jgi:hypothetical protein
MTTRKCCYGGKMGHGLCHTSTSVHFVELLLGFASYFRGIAITRGNASHQLHDGQIAQDIWISLGKTEHFQPCCLMCWCLLQQAATVCIAFRLKKSL